jgi:hypothetical protein
MSESFLLNMMRVALEVTRVERAFAVDKALTVLGAVNMTPEAVEAAYLKCAKKALESNEVIITDNYSMTLAPETAPNTNQSFPKLRAVVFIPVAGHGIICLDQSMRQGILPKDEIDQLTRLVESILDDGQLDLSEDAIFKRYRQMTA